MPRLSVLMIRAALLHLGVGFTFGALMLANKGIDLDPQLWRLLHPHIELLVFGWLVQLAMGVAFWTLPRFTGKQRYGFEPLGWYALVLLNGGILITATAQWLGSHLILLALAGRIAVLLAVISFTLLIWSRVKPLGGYAAKQKRNESH